MGPIGFQFLHSTAKKDGRNMLSFFVSNPTLLLSLCTIHCCATTIHTSSSLTIFIVLFLFFFCISTIFTSAPSMCLSVIPPFYCNS
ncbi:hypothetical protein QL285_030279 [Trifolium repens]|nr:hypothetical protein QL285_030279 [Trifolium repens]